jgi:hypothetical protein
LSASKPASARHPPVLGRRLALTSKERGDEGASRQAVETTGASQRIEPVLSP